MGNGETLRDRLSSTREAVLDAVLASGRPGTEPEHHDTTVALVGTVLHRFLGLLPGSGGRDAAAVPGLEAVGARYAACGVSHGQALYELQRTVIELSRLWWSAVGPGEVAALLRLNQQIEEDLDAVRTALGDGYCAALATSGTRSLGRRQLAESLVMGRPVDERLLAAAGVVRAGQYLVLSTGATTGASGDDVIDRFGVPGVLARREGSGLDVLVPVTRRTLDAPAEVAARGFERLATLTGARVAGAAVALVADLPAAVEEARSTLEIAEACERRGAVLAEQVLVERALTGSASAVRQLADVVEALARWPHLPETLRALYAHDLDRSRTADALHIARRTLTKRLDRIHQLTGIHPTSAHGVQTFLSALAAGNLVRSGREITAAAGSGAC
jgi:hypothetical protein